MVVESLKKEVDLGSQAIGQQFEGLFQWPLQQLQAKGQVMPEYLVVIDALDECALEGDDITTQEEKRKNLITSLCGLQSSWLKIMITSRPLRDIGQAFNSCVGSSWLSMDIMDAVGAEDDIEKYVSHCMDKVAKDHNLIDWPTSQEIDMLVERASGLFIWATTVHKYLSLAPDVRTCLEDILKADGKGDAHIQLHSLYSTIVKSHVRKDIQLHHDKILQMVVMTSKHSLIPIQAYAKVLQISSEAAEFVLKELKSVLYEDPEEGVIRVYHPSFWIFWRTESTLKFMI